MRGTPSRKHTYTRGAAGYNYIGTDNDILLLRFNADGTLDTAYGASGVASWVSGLNEHVFGLALQVDGKALVTGFNYSNNTTDKDIMLARFNADGTGRTPIIGATAN